MPPKAEPSAGGIESAVLEEIGFYFICLVVALLPLSFWPLVYRAFSLPKVVVGYGLIAVLLALLSARLWLFGATVRVNLTTLLAALFCLSLIPSALFSLSPSTAFLGSYRQLAGILSWLAMAAFAFCVSMTAWDEGRLRDLMIAVSGTAAVVSVAAWTQHFWPQVNQIWFIQVDRRPVFATFGNAGYLAAFLAFALPAILALALEAKRTVAFAVYGFIWLIAMGGLVFSGSRGGWAAAAVVLVCGVPYLRGFEISTKRLMVILSLGLAVFIAALLPPVSRGSGSGAARLAGETTTIAARVGYWKAAAKETARRPVTGAGPDTFGLIYPGLSSPYSQYIEPETVTDDAHNVWLQMAATYGLVTSLLFLALVVSSFLFYRVLVYSRRKLLLWGLAAGTAGYLLAVQTTVNSWGTAFIPWLLIGIAGSIAGRELPVSERGGGRRGQSVAGRLPHFIIPVVLAVIVIGLFDLRGLWRADGYFLKAKGAPALRAPLYYRQAARLWPTNESYWLSLAASLARHRPRAAEAAGTRARRAAPLSYLPYQFLAQFYLTDGVSRPQSRALAKKAAVQALKRFPNSPIIKKINERTKSY